MKKISYYFIAILFCVGTVILAVFVYRDSYIRIFDGIKDLGRSIAYWFYNLIGSDKTINISVLDIPKHYGTIVGGGSTPPKIILPVDGTNFKLKIGIYFKSLFNIENFLNYVGVVLNIFSFIMKLLMLLIPLFLLLYFVYRSYFKQNDNHTNSDSKALKIFKFISLKIWMGNSNLVPLIKCTLFNNARVNP
jgi:hypothetical protein